MLKQALSLLTVVAAGAGLAVGQDAPSSGLPASRSTSSYSAANGYEQPITPPGRSSPYGTYQASTATADGGGSAALTPYPAAGCATCGGSPAKCTLQGWFEADYMLLFPSRTSVPTLFNDPTGAPAAGNSPDLGVSNAVRVNTGVWLCDGQIGMQGIALFSFRSTVTSTTPVGTIPLAGGPVAATNFVYQSWHQFGGGEGNTLYRLLDDGATKVYGIAGTRYFALEEDLSTTYNIAGTNFLDEFHTRNQFAGVQVGAKVAHNMGRFDVDATAKLALGVNYTQLWVLGSNDGAGNVQAFTQRSNIGYFESNYFGLIPEVDLSLRYRVTQRLSLNLGYMFMMSINNWRPGEQVSLAFPPTDTPPIRSSYFLHGLTAGATFNY